MRRHHDLGLSHPDHRHAYFAAHSCLWFASCVFDPERHLGTSALASLRPFQSVGRLSGAAWSRRLQRRGDATWAIEQVLRHDWPQILAAGRAIGRFDSTSWIDDVDIPTAMIATLDDEIVPTGDQMAMATSWRILHCTSSAADTLRAAQRRVTSSAHSWQPVPR